MPVAKFAVEKSEISGRAILKLLDLLRIAPVLRRPPIGPEKTNDVWLQSGGAPVHPFVGTRTLARVFGPELTAPVAGSEITDNCVGFPDDRSGIINNRHESVGIHA